MREGGREGEMQLQSCNTKSSCRSSHLTHSQAAPSRLSLTGERRGDQHQQPSPAQPRLNSRAAFSGDNDLAITPALVRLMKTSLAPSRDSVHGELGDIIEDNIVLEDLAH